MWNSTRYFCLNILFTTSLSGEIEEKRHRKTLPSVLEEYIWQEPGTIYTWKLQYKDPIQQSSLKFAIILMHFKCIWMFHHCLLQIGIFWALPWKYHKVNIFKLLPTSQQVMHDKMLFSFASLIFRRIVRDAFKTHTQKNKKSPGSVYNEIYLKL